MLDAGLEHREGPFPPGVQRLRVRKEQLEDNGVKAGIIQKSKSKNAKAKKAFYLEVVITCKGFIGEVILELNLGTWKDNHHLKRGREWRTYNADLGKDAY